MCRGIKPDLVFLLMTLYIRGNKVFGIKADLGRNTIKFRIRSRKCRMIHVRLNGIKVMYNRTMLRGFYITRLKFRRNADFWDKVVL